jgi:hypothetical protein
MERIHYIHREECYKMANTKTYPKYYTSELDITLSS